MKRFAGLAAATIALQGCNLVMTEETARSASIADLCAAFSISADGNSTEESGAAALSELVRRNFVSPSEAAAMIHGPAVGMREHTADCSWGGADWVNTTTTAAGTRRQYVYTYQGSWPLRYIYSENGRIIAIQS